MEFCIIGFPKAGKTTVFNALTMGRAQTASYTTGTLKPNIGVAKVPDPRLGPLAAMFQRQRSVFAEVQYTDIPGLPAGIEGELLNLLQRVDALLHVVRDFRDPAVPLAGGAASPEEAIPGMDLELAAADLGILERRLARLETLEKGAKPHERGSLQQERSLLSRIKASLERDVPVRDQELSAEERKVVTNYHFLTAKPLLSVLNVGEEAAPDLANREEELRRQFGRPGVGFVAMCGKLEMELAELSGSEQEEFRTSLGLTAPGRERVIRASYALLDLVSFLTVGPDEVRAWSIPRGTPAVTAAGRVHTDMERGFIRAELVAYDELVRCGSMAEARKRGLLRQEGKGYRMQDGDVVNFLFNV